MEWDTGTDFDQLLEEVFPPVLYNEFHEFFLDDGNGRFNTVASKKVFNYKNQPLFLDVTVFQS